MLIAEHEETRVHALDAGSLRVDGGAMFGAVPRELWRRSRPPDGRNRIRLVMRPLLVETARSRVLVDAGAGVAPDDDAAELWGLEDREEPTRLERSIAALGLGPEDIDVVVTTHLHFDHAGGLVRFEGGEPVPRFPGARHLVRRGEWDAAHSEHPILRSSYAPAALRPLEERGLIRLEDGDVDVAPGVRTVAMPGHTPHHQGVRVDVGHRVILYPADLVPTVDHVRLSWIMAYDLDPLTTHAEKERWLGRAGREGWWIVFAHDPDVVAGRASPAEQGQGCEVDDIMGERRVPGAPDLPGRRGHEPRFTYERGQDR